MGHRANFVVIENGAAQAYYDNWAGLGAAFAIAEGPGPAIEGLKEFEPTNELLDWAFAEGGFLVDLDERLVIVFGELDDMSDEFADVDEDGGDDPEEGGDFDEDGEDQSDETEPCAEKYASYFAEISPNWHGWRLRYDDRGVDAFAEHLQLRGIASIELQEPSHSGSLERFEFQA